MRPITTVALGAGFNTVTRSRTGVYHLSHSHNPSAVTCNSRNGGFRASYASASDVIGAKETMFCRRCFTDATIQRAKTVAAMQSLHNAISVECERPVPHGC